MRWRRCSLGLVGIALLTAGCTHQIDVVPSAPQSQGNVYSDGHGSDRWGLITTPAMTVSFMNEYGHAPGLARALTSAGVSKGSAHTIASELADHNPSPALTELAAPRIVANHSSIVRQTRLVTAAATAYQGVALRERAEVTKGAQALVTYGWPSSQRIAHLLLTDALSHDGWGAWDIYQLDSLTDGLVPTSVSMDPGTYPLPPHRA